MGVVTRRATLGIVPVGAATLAACGTQSTDSGSPPSAAPMKLVHWMHQNPARNAAVDELIATYRQKFPNVEIVFETLPQATYWEKLTPALVADSGPDSFQLPMGLTQLYFGRGQIATLDAPTASRVNDATWRKTRNDEVVMESLKMSKPRSWIGWDEWQAVYQGAVNRVIMGQQSPRQSLAQAAMEANEAIQRNLPPR
jgi:multiple sugar transport system substrate-binding protein